jgi:hypothetical protein
MTETDGLDSVHPGEEAGSYRGEPDPRESQRRFATAALWLAVTVMIFSYNVYHARYTYHDGFNGLATLFGMLITFPIIVIQSIWLVVLGLRGWGHHKMVSRSFLVFLALGIAFTTYDLFWLGHDLRVLLPLLLAQMAALFLLGRKYLGRGMRVEND